MKIFDRLKNLNRTAFLSFLFLIISNFIILIFLSLYLLQPKSSEIFVVNLKSRLDEYRLIHVNNIANWKSETSKFVYFDGTGRYGHVGYGNKLYGVLSALVMAILSDSACIINWPNIDEYMDAIDLPHFFDSSFIESNFDIEDFKKIKPTSTWYQRKNVLNMILAKIPMKKRFLLYKDIKAYFFQLCSNPKYFKKLNYYGLVSNDTVNNALFVLNNISVSDTVKLNGIFNIGFEVASNLLKEFWSPKERIQRLIDSYTKTEFQDFYVIGLQMRTIYLDVAKDAEKFVDCALKIEKLLLLNSTKYNGIYKQVKWFISSDSQYLIDQFKEYYGDKIIVGEDKLGHLGFNSDFNARTILDNELLALCNEIIITGGSTFGFIAMIRAQRMSYFVESNLTKCHKVSLGKPAVNPRGFAIF